MKKDKRKKLIIYLSMTVIIAAIGLWYVYRPTVTFLDEHPVLEQDQEYHLRDFIASSSGDIDVEDDTLDCSVLGEHSYYFDLSNGFLKNNAVLRYEVVDTTPPQIEIIRRKIYLDPYDPYTIADMLKNVAVDEGTLTFESDLDTAFSGTYLVMVQATDESANTSSAVYEVIVKDEEAPFVLASGAGIVLKRGADFAIEDYLSYGDNADPEPVLEVEGEVDTAKVGKYPLTLSLKDASGNETSWDIIVNVVSRITYDDDDDDDDEVYPFADLISDHQAPGRRMGIDVSEWQGDIDFEQIKKAGCEFVMMRIGFSSKGRLIPDKSFHDNFEGARKAGLPVGIYYYSRDASEEEVLSVLEDIFEELDGEKPELPIVFDWEDFLDFPEYGISFQMLNRLYDVFEEQVHHQGCEAMLYGSKYYLEKIWKKRDSRQVWLAHYIDWSGYQDPYAMWQVCSWGQIDGIDGYVDFDILFEQ